MDGEQKGFLVSVEYKGEGRKRFTGLKPHGGISPQEMLDATLDVLAGLYLQEQSPSQATPEEFCQVVANRLLARLEKYNVLEATLQ